MVHNKWKENFIPLDAEKTRITSQKLIHQIGFHIPTLQEKPEESILQDEYNKHETAIEDIIKKSMELTHSNYGCLITRVNEEWRIYKPVQTKARRKTEKKEERIKSTVEKIASTLPSKIVTKIKECNRNKKSGKTTVAISIKTTEKHNGFIYLENTKVTEKSKKEKRILKLLASQVEMILENRKLHHELEEIEKQLDQIVIERTKNIERLRKKAEAMARTDSLTNLANRFYFDEIANKFFQQTKRKPSPLSLIVVDIDHFKKINDTWGHEMGDVVLKAVAKEMATSIRESDLASRIGGEEFAILLTDTDLDGAKKYAERLQHKIVSIKIEANNSIIAVTASFGVAEANNEDTTLNNTLKRADLALYNSKRTGRNKISTS